MSGCKSPAKSSFVVIEQDFKPGKRYLFKIEHRKYVYKDKSQLEINTTGTFEIVKDSANFREAILTYGKTDFSGLSHLISNDSLARSVDYKEGTSLQMRLSKTGSMISLLNFDSVQQRLKTSLTRSYKETIPGITDAQIESTFALLAPTLNEAESMLGAYFPEVNLFWGLLGDTIQTDSAVHFTQWTINPFDGDPISLKSVMNAPRFKDHIMNITVNQELAQEEAENFSKQLDTSAAIRRFTGHAPTPTPMDSLQFKIDQYYAYNTERHILDRATLRKTYSMGENKIVETFEATLVEE